IRVQVTRQVPYRRVAEEAFDLTEIARFGRRCLGVVFVPLQPRRVRPLDEHRSTATQDRETGNGTRSSEVEVVIEESGRDDDRADRLDPSRGEPQLGEA